MKTGSYSTIMVLTIALIIAAASLVTSERYTYVPSKLDKVVYIYPENVKKDQDLDVCQADSVCGVVNQRFWLPPFVHRFCRCPKSQCPFSWSDLEANNHKNDNKSIPLDNRSQLKTCEDTRNLKECYRGTVGLKLTELLDPESGKATKDVRILCSCKWPAYWRLNLREANATVTYNEYTCSPLTRCKADQFCGHMRADTFSTYYQCSCPRDHICINNDRVTRNVTELLYHGLMLRAHCVPSYHPNNV